MADLTFYDAAWPPVPPPETDGVCIYIGGDAVHVWTLAEIQAQKARYRLPVFVRSTPRGISGVAADVNAALAQLAAIGAPRGILVAFDLETAADKTYIAGVYSGLAAHGYELLVYGSESSVMGNDNPDGLYFAADWTGSPHLAKGSVVTQWVSFAAYDEDLAEPGLPFWDTQAKPPVPPPVKATTAKHAAPAPVSWTTAGIDSIAQLAASHHCEVSAILRLTAENSPDAEYEPAVATWINDVFTGTVPPDRPMPAGLVLYLPA